MEDLLNEIKDYTNEQLLSGISLAVMHRIYCKDRFIEAQNNCFKYKEAPGLMPQSFKDDFYKWKTALSHAQQIEQAYKQILIERGVIKMSSENQ